MLIKFLSYALFIFVVCYVLFALSLFIFQRSFIYFPAPVISHPFSEVSIVNDGEKINVIIVDKKSESAILYFGGNGETVAATASDFDELLPNISTYLVEYRGYGKSSGKPSEQVLYSDALKVYDLLASKHQNVYVIGRSLGSGVAMMVAAERDVSKLVLVTPFDSVESVAQSQFAFLPVSLLLTDKFDSVSKVKKVNAQTMIIIAELDDVIPLLHTRKLLDSFKHGQANKILIKGANHNSLSNYQQYYSELKKFLR